MTTVVKCIYSEAEEEVTDRKYVLIAYCHEDYVSEFKFDPGKGMVAATGICEVDSGQKQFEIVVENLHALIRDDVSGTRDCLQAQANLAKQFDADAALVVAPSVEKVAEMRKGQKRCRTISQYPSDLEL